MERRSLCQILDAPDERCTITERNQILLPPPLLVSELNLAFNNRTACFVDKSSGEVVIACDGAPGNYYEEPIHNLMLMRKDIYDELAKNEVIVFFAFSERFHKDNGYGNDCDRHWEFLPDGTLIADYPNGGGIQPLPTPDFCKGCYFSSVMREERQNESQLEFANPNWLEEIKDIESKYFGSPQD